MAVVEIKPKEKIRQTINVPGDKSITHRAVILSSIASGKSEILDYLDGDDCRMTIQAFKKMGVSITKWKKRLIVESKGIGSFTAPEGPVYAGNSGTTARLLAGVLAGRPFSSSITGDESLCRRPMKRIIEPLSMMGARIEAMRGQYLPLNITGNPELKPIRYQMPVASAQVKSCLLLAGIQAAGLTTIVEPVPTRDHTERMFECLGVPVKVEGNSVSVEGPVELKAGDITVPGDFSSAAFFIVAALLLKDSEIEVKNIGLNIRRIGLLQVLSKMGAKLSIKNVPPVCSEPVGNVIARTSRLNGIEVDPGLIPLMIDEIPLLALAATQAHGRTVISGAGELRVKESDRIKTVSEGLVRMGAKIEETPEGMIIEGPAPLRGAAVSSHKDHRIAMMLAIAGLCASGTTSIDDAECVDISFPGFWETITK